MRKSICIEGFYGEDNLGDDIILESLISFFNNKNFDIKIVSNADLSIDKKVINKKKYKNKIIRHIVIIKEIIISDYFILGGGGLFPADSFMKNLNQFVHLIASILLQQMVFHKK